MTHATREHGDGPERAAADETGGLGEPDRETESVAGAEPGVGVPDLASLQARLAAFAAARDWGPFHTPKNLASALSVEAAELLEIFQWLTPEQSARIMDDPDSAHRVRDEVADVLAYLLQLCEVLGVDALAALDAKIDRNESRFPAPGPESRADRSDRHSSES